MYVLEQYSRRPPTARLLWAAGVAAAILLLPSCVAVSGHARAAQGPGGNPPEAATRSEDAAKLLREGRELLDAEQWAQAEAVLSRLVREYPRDTNTAAGLYWLAYTLKQQQQYPAAGQQLDRLFNEFPQSGWAEDGRLMQVELADRRGDARALDEALRSNVPDRQLIALQGLLQTDPEAALAHAVRLLKSDAEAGPAFKGSIVVMLGRFGGRPAASLLVEVGRAQGANDPKLRRAVATALGQPGNEVAVDYLGELLTHSDDVETTAAAIYALSRIQGGRARALLLQVARSTIDTSVRTSAVQALSRFGGEAAAADLASLYAKERDATVKRGIIHALARVEGPGAQARLLEIVRTSEEPELRKEAIFWLGRQGDDESAAGVVGQLYDAERDEQVKQLLLYKLSRLKSKRALLKLMDVAQKDASSEMRARAVFWLSRSTDPEAVRFLRGLRQ